MVFLAPIFAFSFEFQTWLFSLKAFISFCLIASSIYLINDCVDKNKDKNHPIKKNRAISSGKVSVNSALKLSLLLLLLSLLIGFSLNKNFIIILILYYIIQLLYCFFLKNIPLLELFCIASGFIIRSVSGGLASGIFISNWFLLSIGMLSLFIAVEKRKAEIINLKKGILNTRKVLKTYSLPLINKFESILTSCTVMAYSLWAYGPQVGGANSPLMMITIPLVILGIFRYQILSENNYDKIGKKLKLNILETPEDVFLNDRPIQIIVTSWLLIIIYIGLLD